MSSEKPPKLLYAVFLFSPDATAGIQNKLAQYAPCFGDCGIDIVVFNPVRDEVAGNVRWIRYEHAGSRWLKLRLMFWKYRYLARFLRTHHYDTVLLRYGFFDFSMPSLFRGRHAPRIAFEFHSKGLEEIWRYRLPLALRTILYLSERLFSAYFIRRAGAIVAVTSEIARYESERCGSRAPLHTFSNGFDTGKVVAYRGDPPGDRFVIAFAAALFQPWHGLDRLLESLLRMPADARVRLHLVGKVHNAGELQLIRRLSADPRCDVVMHGLVPAQEVGKVLAGAHLAVDSLGMYRLKMSESSTLKAKEYLAMGIPYIGSAVDVDSAGIGSFLAVPNDGSLIAIEDVIRWRRNLRVPLGDEQLAAARERLTWPHKVSRLKQFLAGLA